MKRWAVLYAMLILGIIIAADTRHLGLIGLIYEFPNGDKIGHFVLYGILSLLVNLSTLEASGVRDAPRRVVFCSLLLAALIGLEELSQHWIPSRTFSLLDLAASYAGVVVFALLAMKMRSSAAFSGLH